MTTPCARTLMECRDRGWLPDVVERRVPGKKNITRDYLGFIDVLAITDLPGVLGIQATTGANHADRMHKILGPCSEAARAFLSAGNRVAVWSWSKRGKAGARKLWTLRETPVTLDMLAEGS